MSCRVSNPSFVLIYRISGDRWIICCFWGVPGDITFPMSCLSSHGSNPSGIEAKLISSFMFLGCDSAFMIRPWLNSLLTNVTLMPFFARHCASSINGITWPCAGYGSTWDETKNSTLRTCQLLQSL